MESARLETTLVFGLRYLEEEDLEINDIVGCLVPADDGGGGGTPTSYQSYYATGCDYTDSSADAD